MGNISDAALDLAADMGASDNDIELLIEKGTEEDDITLKAGEVPKLLQVEIQDSDISFWNRLNFSILGNPADRRKKIEEKIKSKTDKDVQVFENINTDRIWIKKEGQDGFTTFNPELITRRHISQMNLGEFATEAKLGMGDLMKETGTQAIETGLEIGKEIVLEGPPYAAAAMALAARRPDVATEIFATTKLGQALAAKFGPRLGTQIITKLGTKLGPAVNYTASQLGKAATWMAQQGVDIVSNPTVAHSLTKGLLGASTEAARQEAGLLTGATDVRDPTNIYTQGLTRAMEAPTMGHGVKATTTKNLPSMLDFGDEYATGPMAQKKVMTTPGQKLLRNVREAQQGLDSASHTSAKKYRANIERFQGREGERELFRLKDQQQKGVMQLGYQGAKGLVKLGASMLTDIPSDVYGRFVKNGKKMDAINQIGVNASSRNLFERVIGHVSKKKSSVGSAKDRLLKKYDNEMVDMTPSKKIWDDEINQLSLLPEKSADDIEMIEHLTAERNRVFGIPTQTPVTTSRQTAGILPQTQYTTEMIDDIAFPKDGMVTMNKARRIQKANKEMAGYYKAGKATDTVLNEQQKAAVAKGQEAYGKVDQAMEESVKKAEFKKLIAEGVEDIDAEQIKASVAVSNDYNKIRKLNQDYQQVLSDEEVIYDLVKRSPDDRASSGVFNKNAVGAVTKDPSKLTALEDVLVRADNQRTDIDLFEDGFQEELQNINDYVVVANKDYRKTTKAPTSASGPFADLTSGLGQLIGVQGGSGRFGRMSGSLAAYGTPGSWLAGVGRKYVGGVEGGAAGAYNLPNVAARKLFPGRDIPASRGVANALIQEELVSPWRRRGED